MANRENLPSRSQNVSESGFVWRELISGAQGTLELPEFATFRVRAVGATTVTIDGVLAATMMANEIMVFNTGFGADDTKETVTVVIAAANAFVQVAKMRNTNDTIL